MRTERDAWGALYLVYRVPVPRASSSTRHRTPARHGDGSFCVVAEAGKPGVVRFPRIRSYRKMEI